MILGVHPIEIKTAKWREPNELFQEEPNWIAPRKAQIFVKAYLSKIERTLVGVFDIEKLTLKKIGWLKTGDLEEMQRNKER